MLIAHIMFVFFITVNPLYNDIRYNSKITSSRSAQKISGSCIFSSTVPCYSLRKHTFWTFVTIASPRRFLHYTKRMICKQLLKKIRYSCFRWIHVEFLYHSKFDFTAKSLVTNAVVISRVLCINFKTLLNRTKPATS